MKKCSECKTEIEGDNYQIIFKSESESEILCNRCYMHLHVIV